MSRKFAFRSGGDDADYIVIGSGMGGLASAAVLSRYGNKVMILEQHEDIAGGTLHSFIQGGETIISGFHYCGVINGQSRAVWDEVTDCQAYTVDGPGHVIDTLYDHDGKVGELVAGSYSKELKVPDSEMHRIVKASQWIAFIKLSWYPIAVIVWWLYCFFGPRDEVCMNFEEWMKQKVPKKEQDDRWKKMIWTGQGDHGVARSKCSVFTQAIIHSHYANGIIHPKGGMPNTVARAVKRIVDRGGQVLINARVTELTIDPSSGRAVGCVVDGVKLKAKKGILVSGAHALVSLVPNSKKVLPEVHAAIQKCGNGMAHGCIFLTYKNKSAADLGMPEGNMWFDFMKTSELTTEEDPQGAGVTPGLYISYKNSEHAGSATHASGESNLSVYVIYECPYFVRDANYLEKKEELTDIMLERACKYFPKLRDYDTIDSSTPATSEKYLSSHKGSSYGLCPATERWGDFDTIRALRPETSIPGLYMTGQDCLFWGIMGAMSSGVVAAQAALGSSIIGLATGSTPNVFKDLIMARAERKKLEKKEKAPAEEQTKKEK